MSEIESPAPAAEAPTLGKTEMCRRVLEELGSSARAKDVIAKLKKDYGVTVSHKTILKARATKSAKPTRAKPAKPPKTQPSAAKVTATPEAIWVTKFVGPEALGVANLLKVSELAREVGGLDRLEEYIFCLKKAQIPV